MRVWLLISLLLTGCPDRPAALTAPKRRPPSPATAKPQAKAGARTKPGASTKAAPAKSKVTPASGVVWVADGLTQTFSSPRCADLNGDGVLDVILGHGVTARDPARTGASGSVTAHDGRTGKRLWVFQTDREVVSTPTLAHLDGDGVLDAAIGARDGVFFALSGKTGRALWTFQPAAGAGAPGRLNHYSPAITPDLDGDGVVDLLQASGGDVSIPAKAPRPPGHLLLVSGRSGKLLAAARTPDGGETYTSPLLTGDRFIFGTGGETHPGSLWSASLAELRRGDLTGARQLVKPLADKGFIAAPSLADLNGDGVDDAVATSFDGRVVAVDGATSAVLWSHSVPEGETHLSPVIGQFVRGGRPDVAALISVGVWPKHHTSFVLVVDGDNGKVTHRKRMAGVADGTPVAADLNSDGRDELYYWERGGPDSRVIRWDFQADPGVLWWYRGGRTPSTPWIGDLDGDGRPDWLHAIMTPPEDSAQRADHSFEAAVRWRLERRQLEGHVPRRIAWGAYLGTAGDGRAQ